MYTRKCQSCGAIDDDKYEQIHETDPKACPECSMGLMTRILLPGKANAVIGDEIDVTITNGLCNADSSPRRFRSRQELAAAAKAAGLTNRVEHQGGKSGDRSKHTSRWV